MNPLENLPPFYVGQKVVYTTGANMAKGSIHVVREVLKGTCGCFVWEIVIDVLPPRDILAYDLEKGTTKVQCIDCDQIVPIYPYIKTWNAASFAPLTESPFPSITYERVIEKESVLTSMN